MKKLLLILLISSAVATAAFLIFSYNDHMQSIRQEVEHYLSSAFPDQKLVSGSRSSKEELSRFVLHAAMYHGNTAPTIDKAGKTVMKLSVLEENLFQIFGTGSLSMRCNYDYAPADYDRETRLFYPYEHTPEHNYRVVVHKIINRDHDTYEVRFTYVDCVNEQFFTCDHGGQRLNAAEILSTLPETEEQVWAQLKKEIRRHPDRFEVYRASFSMRDGRILYTGACDTEA